MKVNGSKLIIFKLVSIYIFILLAQQIMRNKKTLFNERKNINFYELTKLMTNLLMYRAGTDIYYLTFFENIIC